MPAPAKRTSKPAVQVEKRSGPPTWLKFVGGVLGVLVAGHFYLMYKIEEVADGLVEGLGLFASASHRGAYYTWNGHLGFKRLRIESRTAPVASLVVQEVELQTPGWWWILQAFGPAGRGKLGRVAGAFGDDSALPSADRMRLVLRDIELDVNQLLPPGMPEIGFASGALFETEGCSEVRYLVPLQLQSDLRLRYEGTNLAFGYEAAGSDLVRTDFTWEAPGVARTRLEMDWRTDDPRHFLESDGEGEKPVSMRLVFEDEGFVEARNRWCAEQAGVDADEFQRRHITTVRRVLEVYGLRLSPEAEEEYSSFARGGGSLTMEAKWPTQVPLESFAQYPPDQQWQMMEPLIWRNTNIRKPMAVEFVRPRPLPPAFAGSVYDLLARNADAAQANADSPLVALGASIGKLAGPAAEPVAAPEPAEAEEAKPKVDPRRLRPQPTPIGLATEELIAAIGERVEVRTDDGRTRTGILLAVDPKVLTVQVSVSGGKADLSFTRARVRAVIANPEFRR